MSSYIIEIDDDKITEQINGILNSIVNKQLHKEYTVSNGLIAEAAREIVYSRKDEIIEKVIERATREIVKKGLPKLIEKMGQSDD